jgi:hypothetical protein
VLDSMLLPPGPDAATMDADVTDAGNDDEFACPAGTDWDSGGTCCAKVTPFVCGPSDCCDPKLHVCFPCMQ